jgi:proteasome accessory factor C
MSDEAFARRFYSDRAELSHSGSRSSRSATSSRARSCTHSAPRTTSCEARARRRRARRATDALYLLEGKFAYAEPLRLALQNLALGRPGFDEPATETAVRVEVLDPDYSPEMPGRLASSRGDLEAAHDQVPVLLDLAQPPERAHGEPVRLLVDNGSWYLIGQISIARTSARSASPHPRRHPLRNTSRARLPDPADFDIDEYAGGRPGRSGTSSARRAIELAGDTAWWVDRATGTQAGSRTTSS